MRAAAPLAWSLAATTVLAAGAASVSSWAGGRRDAASLHAPAALETPSAAQWRDRAASASEDEGDGPAYDGRFTFVRVRWDDGRGGRGLRGFRGGGEPLWAHDMRRGAERNFARILEETTFVGPSLEGKVLTLDDPELFRYPVAYIVEVGYWQPGEAEIEGLRSYLLKGGFLIVDDFRGDREMWNFEAQVRRVLPGAVLQPLPDDHEIFDSFFHIPDPAALAPPTYQQYVPLYLGIFEDNDPNGRLMAVINFNQDIAEYWEYSDMGYYPIDLSNEAYKFGVNYIVYAMTH